MSLPLSPSAPPPDTSTSPTSGPPPPSEEEHIGGKETPPNASTSPTSRPPPPTEEEPIGGKEPPPDASTSPTPGPAPPTEEQNMGGTEPPPDADGDICCDAWTGWKDLLLVLGLLLLMFVVVSTFFIVLIDVTTRSPRFYLSDLRGPPLNAAPGSAANVCEVSIRNRARLAGLEFRGFRVTLRHPSGREASASVPRARFYHPFAETRRREVYLVFDPDTPAPRNGSATVVFQVLLETRYWFRGGSTREVWTSRRHRVRVGADVEVNAEGRMASRERILLVPQSAAYRSSARTTCWSAAVAAVGALIFLL